MILIARICAILSLVLAFAQPYLENAAAKIKTNKALKLPFFLSTIKAGFPSPADDYIDKYLDLNEMMMPNHASSFIVRVKGNSMTDANIFDGDMLVVDRSVEAIENKIVIAVLNDEFTVKRAQRKSGKLYLVAENPDFKPIEIDEDDDFKIWGVVTYVIHKV